MNNKGQSLVVFVIILPIILLLVGVSFAVFKGFNFGIDFTGGTDITVTAKNTSLKDSFKKLKAKDELNKKTKPGIAIRSQYYFTPFYPDCKHSPCRKMRSLDKSGL